MIKLNEKGAIAQVLIFLLLIAGVAVGVYLVQTRTNLLPRAASGPIIISPFEKAIKLDGQSYVFVPGTKTDSNNTACPTGTLEMWVKMDRSNLGRATRIIGVFGESYTGFDLSTNGSGTLAFIMYGQQMFSQTPLTPDQWYHIAIVNDFYHPTPVDRRGIYIYLNGKEDGFRRVSDPSLLSDICQKSDGELRIGRPNLGFIGEVDEVVFDNSIKYTKEFTPPTTPLKSGSIIYHFDGNLQDSAFFKLHGQAAGNVQFVESTLRRVIGDPPRTPTGAPPSTPITKTPTPTKPPVSVPVVKKIIKQFKVAETPTELKTASWQNYKQDIVISYIFKNISLGPKFLFIQFRDGENELVKIGGGEYISSQIELVAKPTPTPNPIAVPIIVQPDATTIKPGQITSINILSGSAEVPLGAWSIDVRYNPTVVKAKECTPSTAALIVCNPNYQYNAVRISGATATGITGLTSLATIKFEAVGIGTSSMISPAATTFADINEAPVTAQVSYGSISVSGVSAPEPSPQPTVEPTPTALPTTTPTLTPPIGGPVTQTITEFRFAENPVTLKEAKWQPYKMDTILSHEFSDPTPGIKSLFLEFRDDKGQLVKIGGQDYITSSILLEEVTVPTPSPTAEFVPAPSEEPTAVPTPVYATPYSTPSSGGGGGGGSSGGTKPTVTPASVGPAVEYRVAENLVALQSSPWKPYTSGMTISFTFSDSSPGLKTIFIQFRDAVGRVLRTSVGLDYVTQNITLDPQVGPTPATASLPVPRASDGPNCPFENPGAYSIERLYQLCSVNQLTRFDLKWLKDFPNHVLIDIGRRKGNLGAFLADFTGERLLGLPPFKPEAAFSLEILRELPESRKRQLPGYIYEQIK